MAFPTAVGSNYGQYSGQFIPQVWAAKLNAKFYATTVFGAIANTDYEGEIRDFGDRVTINNVPTIAIRNYTVGTPLTYDVPTPTTVDLFIDKGKYFAFEVNDVMELQSKPNLMDTFTSDASAQLRVAVDSNILFNTYSKAAAANVGATAGVNTQSYNLGTDTAPLDLTVVDEALNAILRMASVLDEQNAPDDGRWCVIDPATRNALMRSKLSEAQITGDATSPLRNGKIGRIDRFDLYLSNLLPRIGTVTAGSGSYQSGDGTESGTSISGVVTGQRIIMAGHRSAITFASQIVKTEQLRNQNDFGDYVRGLHVYGFEVLKPDTLTYAVVKGS